MEFGIETLLIISFLFFAAALLYSSVGHGGGSAYLAMMALFGFAPDTMKTTALSLNIIVSFIATIKYYRASYFSWRLFWPFALTSIPLAFIGGWLRLPGGVYRTVVGFILLFAAYQFFKPVSKTANEDYKQPNIAASLLIGSGIGILSGLTGVGGGIFLSPLLVFLRWADFRTISGIAAPFILVNSISGLFGHWAKVKALPESILLFGIAVVIGGLIGSELGSRRLSTPALRKLLGLVLAIAGLKFILS